MKSQFIGDEQKPECGSCMSRNVSCFYPGPTFIFESQSSGRKPNSGPEIEATPVTSVSPDGNLHFQSSPIARVERCRPLVDFTTQQPCLRGREHSPSSSFYARPIQQLPQAPAFEDQVGYTPLSTETQAGRGPDTPASSGSARNNGGAEAGLLMSFVSDIVPWIVSTCPGSRFANSLVGLAECQPAVRSAMIAVVEARNKATYAMNSRGSLEDRGGHPLDTVEGELAHVDDALATNVARSLLFIARLFGSRPTSWSKVGGSYLPSKGGLEEPLRYLLQMQGKFGKCAEVAPWTLFLQLCDHQVTWAIACRARILHTGQRATVHDTRIVP